MSLIRKKYIVLAIGLLITFAGLTVHKFRLEESKKNFINLVKNHQEESVSTIAITALPLWGAIKNHLINKKD